MTSPTLSGWSPGFGRNVEHDPRSWGFLAPRLGEAGQPDELHDATPLETTQVYPTTQPQVTQSPV